MLEKFSITINSLKETLNKFIIEFVEINRPNETTLNMLNFALIKNSKIKEDVLEIVNDLYVKQKIDIINKNYIKTLSKFISFNNSKIKAKTIKILKQILDKFGDDFWNFVDLNDKEKEFLKNNLIIDKKEKNEKNKNSKEQNDNNNINKNNNNNNFTHSKSITNILISSENMNINNIKIPKDIFIVNLNQNLQGLLSNDLEYKISCIIEIHDSVCTKYEEFKQEINENINEILKIFITVLKNLFNPKDINKIQIKISKYFVIVLCKILTNKELMNHISYEILYNLSENLFSNLIIENLVKIIDNNDNNNNDNNIKEVEIIFKNLNSSILRILENCNQTEVIICLLKLIKNYRSDKEKYKIASLAIKCLKVVNNNLKNIINDIKVDKILIEIHCVLINLQLTYPDLKVKNQTDENIIRLIKSIISDLVSLKKNKILEDYNNGVKNHEIKDNYILKWINYCLI